MLYNDSYSGHMGTHLNCYRNFGMTHAANTSDKTKTILACLLVLAISVPLSDASCFLEPFKPGMSDGKVVGCLDSEGVVHKFDSKWRKNCDDCSCSKQGIGCCTSYMRPVDYDTEKCVSIFNEETCSYEVVEKNDHSKECPVHSWVG
ncbi:PREDICTED: beta-microseminoprotein J1-like [Acanthisitta chloris]|nr:PREDICTED: beta-microseminoprotein J1-like [Acanthisitta chloris]